MPDDVDTAAMLRDRAGRVVAALSRTEKVGLLSGADFWHTKGLPEHGIDPVMLTDGPHGLRKQAGASDHVGLADSVPATCFPPAVTLGSSWDPALLEEVGAALGRESRAEHVGVLLGPGLNIKRHPAGGRNFEYFSEDPLLSGRCAAALVRGIQSEGVGACLKHFAANNQESNRMRLDTVVDERTMRELYLTGFEIAVTEAAPWTVMSAYNLVNGEHAGESRRLLSDVLRTEWGFDGLVVSDWLAVADRPAGVRAGLDLEMPSSSGAWDARLSAALDARTLSEADVDLACTRVVELLLRVASEGSARSGAPEVDHEAHHALARRAAASGTVLLTNDGLLPLVPEGRIALIGAFATEPRYQGAGSSQVVPTRLDTVFAALRDRLGDACELVYAPGYDPVSGETDAALLAEARRAAEGADAVVLMVGLPPRYESEGFDRPHGRLPAGQETVVQVVTQANPRTAVVLVNGAPVELGWAERPAALVEGYLGGQAGGAALVDVLFGDAEPGGRLAESFPVAVAELPADANFAGHPTQVRYLEGLNVGYRFHDTHDVAPLFCFGHGLGYTRFDYTDLLVEPVGAEWRVALTLTNTGAREGSEVVQVYVHDVQSSVPRPEQELKAFAKVHLAAGESARVELALHRRAFAIYDVSQGAWLVEPGEFEVRVGASSRDLRLRRTIDVDSPDLVTPVPAAAAPVATEAEFAALTGRPLPEPRALLPLHEDSTIDDLRATALGRPLHALLLGVIRRNFNAGEVDEATASLMDAVIGQMPLRGIVAASGGRLGFGQLRAVLRLLNLGRRA